MGILRRTSKRTPRPGASPDNGRPPPGEENAGEGTNAVRHRPDPRAEPIPDGSRKYVPRSPYRTGND